MVWILVEWMELSEYCWREYWLSGYCCVITGGVDTDGVDIAECLLVVWKLVEWILLGDF